MISDLDDSTSVNTNMILTQYVLPPVMEKSNLKQLDITRTLKTETFINEMLLLHICDILIERSMSYK